MGPLTLNSRGTGRIRLAPGLSYRFGTKKRTKAKATYYQHPSCTVHHRTLQAAQRCAAKSAGQTSHAPPVQPLSAPAGWYHGNADPVGSVRYWDGAQWTSSFKP